MKVSPDSSGKVKVADWGFPVSGYPAVYSITPNTTTRLEAVPADGYSFSHWEGAVTGNTNPTSLLMDCDKTVTATFTPSKNVYTLTVKVDPANSGTVKVGNDAVVSYPAVYSIARNSTVTLTAMPTDGYVFSNWSGAVTGAANPISIYMNTDKTITATFKRSAIAYTLTLNVSPDHSGTVKIGNNPTTISDPETYTITGNSTVTLTAMPTDGYVFSNWSGAVTGNTNPTSLYIDGDKNVTATFTAFTPIITRLYFPHVASRIASSSEMWETEVCLINTGNEALSGMLKYYKNDGMEISTGNAITLAPHGRWSRIVGGGEFTDPSEIGYMVFESTSDRVSGYTKFYIDGTYRTAIPVVKGVNTSDIHVSHIASTADWWTGFSLVNTTSATKELTLVFNNGQIRSITLNANEHRAFDIASLFDHQPQPDIQSAVITNAGGIIGLELFGNIGGSNHMEGILLTGDTASTLYYPHVAGGDWWTGIVAYNPSDLECTITITPYTVDGSPLTPITPDPIPGKDKYVGEVSQLDLPGETAWFRIDSTRPLSGFEFFGTVDGNQLAAYARGSGTTALVSVFAKIEKNGWTGIAFVNTEAVAASVTLTAFDDDGTPLATEMLTVGGYAKLVNTVEDIFKQDINSATYVAYSSDRNIVGFQLNGSADGTMLDGLPALDGTH